MKVFVTHAQIIQIAGPVGFDNYIDMRNQSFENVPPGDRFQVQGCALLVQVHQEVEQALFRVRVVAEEGAHPAEGRTGGWLQFQDICAVVGQEPTTKGPGDILAQVQHFHTV